MKNIVILISGRGSNMQAIVDADIPGARIAAVIANRPDAVGLAWAAARGIATVGLDHKQFASREAFDAQLAAEIDAFQPDLVVLAGFMRILGPAFVRRRNTSSMQSTLDWILKRWSLGMQPRISQVGDVIFLG